MQHASDYNIDTKRIALYGTSAGGNLAAVTAIYARDNAIPISGLLLRIPVVCSLREFPSDYEHESMKTHAHAAILDKRAMQNFEQFYAAEADPKGKLLASRQQSIC